MIEIKYIIGGVALAWVLINWIELIIDRINTKTFFKDSLFLPNSYSFLELIKDKLCLKCFSFWIVLLISHDILIASTAGLLAYILDAFVLKKKIEL